MFHVKRVIMKLIYFLVLFFIENNMVNCDEAEDVKSKKPLPFFRRQVEEISEDTTLETPTDDAQSRLVSFLVKNVRKIFTDVDDRTPNIENAVVQFETTVMYSSTAAVEKPNKSAPYIIIPIRIPLLTTTDGFLLYENLTLSSLPYLIDSKSIKENPTQVSVDVEIQRQTETEALLQLTNNLQLMDKEEKNQEHLTILNNSIRRPNIITNDTGVLEAISAARSCIFCNNVAVPACSNPKNKLIPSTVCRSTEELCYSMHTPFGIVERGCYSVSNNSSTYVCTCNLCNYQSMSELPQMYKTKQDWINNVVDLTRTRRLKNSVFKDMSCLKCEVNVSSKQDRDMLTDANCLEGNIALLSAQVCKENEVCAVTAHKSQGYLRRGCVNFPLYNYYMTLCDSDLCNYDAIVSVFDAT